MSAFNAARVRKLNDTPISAAGEYVLYWCQMFRRLTHNHALDYALRTAKDLKKPLVVYEALKLNYPWATARVHTFILEGMRDNAAAAKEYGLTYWPFVETPGDDGHGLVKKLAADAAIIVTDDYPAFIVPAHNRAIHKLPVAVHAVDSNSMIPLALLGTAVSAAVHLRSRIHKLFAEAWENRAAVEPDAADLPKLHRKPPFPLWHPPADVAKFVRSLPVDQSVPALENDTGGATAGRKRLTSFLRNKLARYAEERNLPDSPTRNSASGLSPHLHFGHVSIEEVVTKTLRTTGNWTPKDITPSRSKNDFFCADPNVNSFLDEAITWRDVGYHWHFCRNAEWEAGGEEQKNKSWQVGNHRPSFNFETMDFTHSPNDTLDTVLPAWAKATLTKHAADRREFHYTLEQWENAETHDELWNAAQRELVHTGHIHNYLRMLWGKKVLQWSASPEEAYRVLEHLNNKYAIDGRDPNSYSGILWCFGLFDRPWPPEREVFGSVRYMSSENTARKFDLDGYLRYVNKLVKTGS
ncbi:cryptochrome/DNA photolyase family protein [Limnoglobus roseus]|uniref:Deoxyribodipyrimidine photo-lyase n=1 Tax=Limnoglobus roseus TaxID=2598579 RepID=A0A5C1AP55_9BACT|nr:deoxyribodipyrimidine photolyase [Limnoglobus roseus]QEL19796.1 deoxyribodipyrimidine photolyase [Limnoglobus roseus]